MLHRPSILAVAAALLAAAVPCGCGDSSGDGPALPVLEAPEAEGDRAPSGSLTAREEVDAPPPTPEAPADEARKEPRQRPTDVAGPPSPSKMEHGYFVQVYDRVTTRPVYGIRAVVARPDAPQVEITSDNYFVDVPLAPGTRAELVVEADGYTPSDPVALEVDAPGGGVERIRVELTQKAAGSGVTLRLLQPDGQPVPQARLVASVRELGSTDRRSLLWERQALRADGVYPLPDLKPGDYEFRLYPFTKAGLPLPLQPAEKVVAWGGSGQVNEVVQFEEGQLVELDVSVTGNASPDDLRVRVLDAAGRPVDTLWAVQVQQQWIRGINALPAAGTARLEGALAPGAYTIEVRSGSDGPAASERVTLSPYGPPARVTLTVRARN